MAADQGRVGVATVVTIAAALAAALLAFVDVMRSVPHSAPSPVDETGRAAVIVNPPPECPVEVVEPTTTTASTAAPRRR